MIWKQFFVVVIAVVILVIALFVSLLLLSDVKSSVKPGKQIVTELGAAIISCSSPGPIVWMHNGKAIDEEVVHLERLDNNLHTHCVFIFSGKLQLLQVNRWKLVFKGTSVLESSSERL